MEPQNGPERNASRIAGGERRVVTALFCDVVNSTSLAEQMDPEDWAEIVGGAFERLTAAVLRYGGAINKLMGDGLLALFGAPEAHEDDPHRAVLAGLAMIETTKVYGQEIRARYGFDFNVRVGINTGTAVVGEVGSPLAADNTAIGDAVNIAARMEQTAAPGVVQISGDTYRHVAPLFDVEALGEIELKGKAAKVSAYRVVGEKAEPGRLRGLEGVSAPIVGREEELATLRELLDRVRGGKGHIVCLMGEAGLGKSRLINELAEEWCATAPDDTWVSLAGVPYDASRPFGVFQNYARSFFGVELDDPADVIHQKVATAVRDRGASEDAVALCSVAFERVIAAKVLHEGRDFPADVIKKDIYDVVYPGFKETCTAHPTVLVGDDLHWADPASVDLLAHLFGLIDEVPILFILAFRPERQSPAWQLKLKAETEFPHRYTEMRLKPLTHEAADTLVSELLDIADLPPELRTLILRKADGNPYFVEEIVRTLIDDGIVTRDDDGMHWRSSATVDDIAIPDNLQALLMSRIDRLDHDTKATLQVASVIGRSFYYRILNAISDTAMGLDRHLGSLERVELVREASRRPELEYMFRHELARDAAYGSILNRRRREFHRQVGEAIETVFADRIEENAHRLGHHFMLAGDHEKARRYYEMAGDSAAAVSAPEESYLHYARAAEAARQAGQADVAARIEAKSVGAQTR